MFMSIKKFIKFFELKKNNDLVNAKGFIGAIGDDLPALIPIIIGILIFFSVFTNTLIVYDQKNVEIRQQIELSSISRTVKTDSLILSFNEFERNCNMSKLKRSNYNYMIGIYPNYKFDVAGGTQDIIDDFINASQNAIFDNFVSDNHDYFFCSYRKVGGSEFSSRTSNYLIRFYPVALQKRVILGDGSEVFIIEPSIMSMVVWN